MHRFLELWMKAVPFVCLAVGTVVLNLIVLWMFRINKALRSSTNVYLASLALADCMVGMSMFPAAIQLLGDQTAFTSLSCWFYLGFRQLGLYMSLISLLLMAVDRWWSVQNPLSFLTRRSKKHATLAVVSAWIWGSILQVALVAMWASLSFSKSETNSSGKRSVLCQDPFTDNTVIMIVINVFQYCIPLLAIVTLNSCLYSRIQKRNTIGIRRSASSPETLSLSLNRARQSIQYNSSPPCRKGSKAEMSSLDSSLSSPTSPRGQGTHFKLFCPMTKCNKNMTYRSNSEPALLSHSISPKKVGKVVRSSSYSATSFSSVSSNYTSELRKGSEGRAEDLIAKQNRRAALKLGMTVIVALVCYVPHIVVLTLCSMQTLLLRNRINDITHWILLAHSLINPIVYGFFNKKVRKTVRLWLAGRTRPQYRSRIHRALLYHSVSVNFAVPSGRRISCVRALLE